ncbi:unnamed protein product [Rhizoctonia solani]|uniref:Vegetative incompatibility protein HET-E-1 [Podospora anserina] n=1 Tax=Rhizoctonia solani TaxID=456999 RepID=A0A8H3ABV0_9AGAM|nr:unnamed protein product [Rhizoctonia solani]
MGHKKLGFSPGGDRIVSGSNDQTVCVWDVKHGEMALGPLEKTLNDKVPTAYSPSGACIISDSRDGLVLWDAETGNVVFGPFQLCRSIHSASFSADGNFVIVGSTENTLQVMGVHTGEIITEICPPLTDQSNRVHVTSAVFSPDGSRIAVGTMHYCLSMFDSQSGDLLYGPLGKCNNGSNSLAFSPDGTRIASGSFSEVLVWDVQGGFRVLVLMLPKEHGPWVHSVGYSPDGNYIITGARDNTICVWNARTGKPVIGPVKWHMAPVRSVRYSPDGARVVSGSDDRTIRVTDVRKDQFLSNSLTPTGCEWELKTDGWVVDTKGRLLVWIPPDLRASLMWPRTQLLISRKGWLRLDFTGARLGESWAKSDEPKSSD